MEQSDILLRYELAIRRCKTDKNSVEKIFAGFLCEYYLRELEYEKCDCVEIDLKINWLKSTFDYARYIIYSEEDFINVVRQCLEYYYEQHRDVVEFDIKNTGVSALRKNYGFFPKGWDKL